MEVFSCPSQKKEKKKGLMSISWELVEQILKSQYNELCSSH